jgi:hypothetical protein
MTRYRTYARPELPASRLANPAQVIAERIGELRVSKDAPPDPLDEVGMADEFAAGMALL